MNDDISLDETHELSDEALDERGLRDLCKTLASER